VKAAIEGDVKIKTHRAQRGRDDQRVQRHELIPVGRRREGTERRISGAASVSTRDGNKRPGLPRYADGP
jgi:hypothetical protein